LNKKQLFLGRPKKIGKSNGKRESKVPWDENFKDFAIFNGIRAMAILVILFCM